MDECDVLNSKKLRAEKKNKKSGRNELQVLLFILCQLNFELVRVKVEHTHTAAVYSTGCDPCSVDQVPSKLIPHMWRREHSRHR